MFAFDFIIHILAMLSFFCETLFKPDYSFFSGQHLGSTVVDSDDECHMCSGQVTTFSDVVMRENDYRKIIYDDDEKSRKRRRGMTRKKKAIDRSIK